MNVLVNLIRTLLRKTGSEHLNSVNREGTSQFYPPRNY